MKNRNLDHKDDWQTPEYILSPLKQEFGQLFDPCPLNHDMSWNGLEIEWKQNNFINPPYSRELKELFIKKAYLESQKGKNCIMLLPVSTSTKIFHTYIYIHTLKYDFSKEESNSQEPTQEENLSTTNVGCMILCWLFLEVKND